MPSRRLEPEWLDELSPDDPRAIRSRRDLRRVNAWMLQVGIMRRLLLRNATGRAPRSIVDLGCGDGAFALALARRLAPIWPGVTLTLVDRQAIVADRTRAGFGALGWRVETVSADVFEFLRRAEATVADIVTSNLFIHHFNEFRLTELLARIAGQTNLFVAGEPRRSAFAEFGCRMQWAIGCNDVTRHDALVSVRAGFSGEELSRLWPQRGGWRLSEGAAGLFTHGFAARREAA